MQAPSPNGTTIFRFRLGKGDEDIANALNSMPRGKAAEFVKASIRARLRDTEKLDRLIEMVQQLLDKH